MVGMLASDFAKEEGISIDEAKDLIWEVQFE